MNDEGLLNNNNQTDRSLLPKTIAPPLNGILNLFERKHRFLKVFWSICLIFFTGYCSYSIYLNIYSYFEYAVVTQIQTFYENPTLFPTITICNANMFTSFQGIDYVNQVLSNNSIEDIRQTDKFMKYALNQKSSNIFGARTLAFGNVNEESNELKSKLGLDWYFMTSMCIFGNGACWYEKDFSWYFHNEYGNCFQFNSGKNSTNHKIKLKKSTRTGRRNGLSMILFTGYPSNLNSLTYENGIRIFIHNQTESPSSVEGISLSPGMSTNVVFSKRYHKRLPKPFNDCYDDLTSPEKFDSLFYRKTLELGYEYKQMNCLNLCIQDFLIKNCNCSDPLYPKLYNVSYCKSPEDSKCLYFMFKKLYDTNANKKFLGYCPLECSYMKYDLKSLSMASFPSDESLTLLLDDPPTMKRFEYIKKNMTKENIKKYYLQVSIFFGDLRYSLISEKAKQTLFDLMSSIGGTLGLYLGISFISFIEIFEVLIIRFINYIQSKSNI